MHLLRSTVATLTLAILAAAPCSTGAQDATRTIEIQAKRFGFTPAEITLTRGDPVTLALTSDDAPHSLLIEGLGVNAPMVKGRVTQVTITPKEDGDFKGRCGRFCGSGHGTMTFIAHVTSK